MDGTSPKMALELRTDPKKLLNIQLFGKAVTGSPVIVAHCGGSVRYTDIVHKAVLCEESVN